MKNNRRFRKAISILLVLCIACPYFGTTAKAAEEDTDTDTAVSIAAISGVTAPVTGETPVTEITPTAQYTGTIEWSPNDSTFVGGRVYSANITLTPKDGYSLKDVTKNFFTVSGTTSVSNAAGSGFTTAVFPTTAISGGSILYVNKSAAGENDGTSWTDAYTDLQAAITASVSGDQIWVAAGTYTPAVSDRDVSFDMKDGVALFGGFAGTETEFSQRDYNTNVTILSGDLSGDDDFSDNDEDGFDRDDFHYCTENSYRVVSCMGLGSSAVLDGFTIQGGYNNRDSSTKATFGGGIYMYQSSTTLSNLIVRYNAAKYFGGGIYMTDGTNVEYYQETGTTIVPFVPVLTNVTITMNSYTILADSSGSGLFNKSGDPILTHVTFDQNEAKTEGAGMLSYGDPILTDVTFSNNFGENSVGGAGLSFYSDDYGMTASESRGVYLRNVTFTGNTSASNVGSGGGLRASHYCYLTDVTFTGNTAGSGGGMFGANATMNHVTFDGNTAHDSSSTDACGGGYYDLGGSTLNDVVFTNNEADFGGGMYTRPGGNTSPQTDVNYTGNTAAYGGGLFVEPNPSTRTLMMPLSNLTFTENHASVEGGGMYNSLAYIDLKDATFTRNTADGSGGGLATGYYRFVTGSITYYFEVTLTGVSFDQNSAGVNAGGFYAAGGCTSVYSSSFTNNTAEGRGGGYYSEAGGVGDLITNCVFSGNSATDGGGLVVFDEMTDVTDTLICNNTATGNGGGIYDEGGLLCICNITIADNTAGGVGGGIYIDISGGIIMANSIIWGNTAAACSGIYDKYLTIEVISYTENNIIQSLGGSKINTEDIIEDYEVDFGSNMKVDPQFVGDGSYRLKDTSPGIDAGTASAYAKIEVETLVHYTGYGKYKPSSGYEYRDREVSDFDGNSRLVNGYYDIGAYERQDVGSISGTVTDQSGTPLSGAAVTVSGCGYTATTAADGTYTVLAVAAGSHTVTAAFAGYPNATANNVSVTADQTTPSVNLVVDNAVPTVSGVTPSGTGAAISGNIAVTFSEAMDPTAGTVSLDGGTTALTSGTWSNGNTVYTLAYSGLSCSTAYTVTVSGFKDSAGNEMESDNTHSFTTGAEPSTDKILISITTPTAITGLVNGTAKTASALGLPSTVSLVTDNGTVSANVTWDVDSCSYDASSTNAQTFTVSGTVTLPSGVVNTNNVSLSTSISVTVNSAVSTDKTLTSVTAPDAITGLTNGTAKTAAALGLPSTVTLVTDDGNVSASVSWDVASCSYDAGSASAQTFTVSGTVALPSGVVNTNNILLTTSISVSVSATVSTDKILVSITAPTAITGLANGTAKTASALGLPSTVSLVTDNGTVSANVTWDVASCSYDEGSTNAQTFTVSGTVILPDGVVNTNNVSLTTSISVTVNSAVSTDKILVSVTAPTAITGLTNGTAKTASALGLPSTVSLVTDNGTVSASVAWDVASCSYDAGSASAQTFTVSGTVALPSGVVNTNNILLTTSISVSVSAAASGDTGENSGGPSGSGSSENTNITVTTENNTTTVSQTVTASTGSNGIASASVTGTQISELIAAASEQAAKANGQTAVEISVKADSGATGVSVTVPKTAASSLADSASALTIASSVATLTFDSAAITEIGKQAGGDITISITTADTSALSEESKAAIGGRPVYDLTVTSGGTTVSDFGGGTATVRVPYTPADSEDTNDIVIYYLSDSGDLVIVPNCIYDAETGMVTFTTMHFSSYAVGYNDVSFTDVAAGAWYEDYVSFLAARGILSGAGDGTFSPDANITRAQFVTILAKMSGDDLTGYTSSSFKDVQTTDWYFAAVQWAFKNGVVYSSDGIFNPNDTITRQDIAVMIQRYANEIAGYTLPETTDAVTFTDSAEITSYAAEAVTAMQRAGIISGNTDGSFAPDDYATRAQSAKMIAILIQSML